MDALIAKADAIQHLQQKKRSSHGQSKALPKIKADHTMNSVVKHTSLPKSLKDTRDLPQDGANYKHMANKKLRVQLTRQSEQKARAKALVEDADMLLMENAGGLVAEGEMERTWRVGQKEIVQSAGQEAAKGRQEYRLDGGPYQSRFTRNGRHLAMAGRTGHLATFDWKTGTLHAELQVQETCRDITFLQDHTFFAVAQKKYVFIYDHDGVELHRLKAHIEPTRLEFLPYHWLLASVGNAGYLKYQDTSTGQLLVEHRTKFGACNVMTQNLHNAIIHLGHQNGRVTLWSPNLPHPAVQLLAHLGPVVSVSVDPSQGGKYMATAGRDGTVKVWDCRNWRGAVREWSAKGGNDPVLEWSQRGYLAVASGGTVNVYQPPSIRTPFNIKATPPLYMTHPIPHRPLTSVRFAPFQDTLTIGHAFGLSNILIPGSGEPNFDSREADPFENRKARKEREVKTLLDKVQPDLITLDPELIGNLASPSKLTTETTFDGKPSAEIPYARLPRIERLKVSGKIDVTEEHNFVGEGELDGEERVKRIEEKEKRKMRGKNKSLKRYLRKKRKNVIDPAAISIRKKMEKQKMDKRRVLAEASGSAEQAKLSALDRFKQTK